MSGCDLSTWTSIVLVVDQQFGGRGRRESGAARMYGVCTGGIRRTGMAPGLAHQYGVSPRDRIGDKMNLCYGGIRSKHIEVDQHQTRYGWTIRRLERLDYFARKMQQLASKFNSMDHLNVLQSSPTLSTFYNYPRRSSCRNGIVKHLLVPLVC